MLHSVGGSAAAVLVNLILCWIISGLRCYSRVVLVKSFWLDDALAILSLLLFTVSAVIYVNGLYHHGLAHHIFAIADLSTIELAVKDIFLGQIFYFSGTGFIKISFALTLLRFIPTGSLAQFALTYGTIAVVAVSTTGELLYNIFSCSPVQYSWTQAKDPYILALALGKDPASLGLKPQGHCQPFYVATDMGYAHAAILITVDITLGLVMPVLLLRNLTMGLKLKITTGVLLALGAVASLASIMRIPYIHYLVSLDFLYLSNPLFVWSALELAWAIFATACTTLKPVAKKLGFFNEADNFTAPSPVWRTPVLTEAKDDEVRGSAEQKV